MPTLDSLTFHDGAGTLRPRGACSLVEAVDLVSAAIERCREKGVQRLLVDATGLEGLPIPTLLDRFLMVEDWAAQAGGRVAVALVAQPEYIHPRKFGVTVARHLGLVCDIYDSEREAEAWLFAATDVAAG
ncbi:MAG: hypothetical protein U1F48_00140 [Burkholderiales bacterium]